MVTTIPYPKRVSIARRSQLLDEYVGRYENAPGVSYEIYPGREPADGQRKGFKRYLGG